MLNKLFLFISKKSKTPLIKNSFWGIISNISQNLLFSAVFVIIARKYSTNDFGSYVLANTIYAFVLAFSSLGLGQWFIREMMNTDDKKTLINKFFKKQLYIGVIFYVLNVIVSYSLYDSQLIRSLSLLVGINLIFDNMIYVIKQINIAELEQRKTFVILTIEAVLKFMIASLLFIFPIPILTLAVFLIVLRFISLNLFIKIGSSNLINLSDVLKVKVSFREVKELVVSNYAFTVIGSISVVYWRIGNILVSKILTLKDVTQFDISLKLWSIAAILPFIVSTSIFPLLVKSLKSGKNEMQRLYKNAFLAYGFYGIFTFTAVFTFSDFFIPYLFGAKYVSTPVYCKELFLTILLVPTALLQANVFIAMKLEKLDMLYNLISLVIYLLLCAIGFYYFKSLSVVNYGIFISFLSFHLLQDIYLIRKKILTLNHAFLFYTVTASLVGIFYFFSTKFNVYYVFFVFWALILVIAASIGIILYKKQIIGFKHNRATANETTHIVSTEVI